jgi:hypothetical protein
MDVQKRIAKENPCQRIRNYSKRAAAEKRACAVNDTPTGRISTDPTMMQKAAGFWDFLAWGTKTGFLYVLVPALFGMGFTSAYFLIDGTKRLASGFAKSSDAWARDMTIKSICDELADEFDFAARQAEEEKKKRQS